MLGGAGNPHGELPSYITGADITLWIPSVHSPVENIDWLKCSGIRISYLVIVIVYALYLSLQPVIALCMGTAFIRMISLLLIIGGGSF
ncbi:hypothetical protein OM329_21300 [Escherichia albertii]|uniref:Uncharacterized protein n=1 Tax=Escherichia albertii TaxID=208962 RepID=A0A7Z8DX00_ESCAL|nr:hypothetical protein [Escherichia albertii]TBR47951.1 hypothetical protein EYS06_22650 [Escherichia albertii]HEB1414447.1 hypothetical protein [Escherichia albertii]